MSSYVDGGGCYVDGGLWVEVEKWKFEFCDFLEWLFCEVGFVRLKELNLGFWILFYLILT